MLRPDFRGYRIPKPTNFDRLVGPLSASQQALHICQVDDPNSGSPARGEQPRIQIVDHIGHVGVILKLLNILLSVRDDARKNELRSLAENRLHLSWTNLLAIAAAGPLQQMPPIRPIPPSWYRPCPSRRARPGNVRRWLLARHCAFSADRSPTCSSLLDRALLIGTTTRNCETNGRTAQEFSDFLSLCAASRPTPSSGKRRELTRPRSLGAPPGMS